MTCSRSAEFAIGLASQGSVLSVPRQRPIGPVAGRMGDQEYAVQQPSVGDENMADGSLEDLKKELPAAEHPGIVIGSVTDLQEGGLEEQQPAVEEIPGTSVDN